MGETGRFDSRALMWQMAHARPLVGGYVSRIAPRIKAGYQDWPAIAALIQLSSPHDDGQGVALPDELARALRADGIRYVIVNTDRIALTRQELEPRGLRFLLADDARELYRVGDD